MSGQGWTVGEIPLATTRGTQVVAGWLKGYFAIDFRVFLNREEEWQGGWAITHLPTGYVTRRIFSDLRIAQAFTDALADLGDWSFTEVDAHTIAPLGKAVKLAMMGFAGTEICGAVAGEIAPTNLPLPEAPAA